MGRRYLIRTFGCQMNEHDSERLAGLFEADGMEPASGLDDADVVVLNTCCVRENADNKLYGNLGHLRSLKEARPDLEIVVGGCLAQKDRDVIRERAPHVDVVFGTHNVHRATALLEQARTDGPVVEIWDEAADDVDLFPSALPVRRDVPWSAWVTIQIGCDNSCAFCIVPLVRGREMSRPFGDVVTEVERAAADGVVEVTLLGQNVNSYGRDLTLARRRAGEAVRVRPLFAELLRAVGAVEGIRRVRFTSPHPKDLRPETIEAMAITPAVCEHLHLPLQAGSDRVLADMHRGYTADRYLERLAAARAAVPDLAVTTDLIVGFPGETDADFDRTLEVVADAALRQRLHVHLLAPARHRGGRAHPRLRPGRGGRRALRAAACRRGALGPFPPRGACRSRRRDRGGGTEQEGPVHHLGPHPAEQARPLPYRPAAASRDLRRGSHRDGPGPLPDRRAARRHRGGPAPHPHRGCDRVVADR